MLARADDGLKKEADVEVYNAYHEYSLVGKNKRCFEGRKQNFSFVKNRCPQNLHFWCDSSWIYDDVHIFLFLDLIGYVIQCPKLEPRVIISWAGHQTDKLMHGDTLPVIS